MAKNQIKEALLNTYEKNLEEIRPTKIFKTQEQYDSYIDDRYIVSFNTLNFLRNTGYLTSNEYQEKLDILTGIVTESRTWAANRI